LQKDIYGGDSVTSAAKIFKTIIEGKGTEEQTNVVLTNAAFALKIVDKNKTFEEAFSLAKDSLFGGRASQCLEQLISNC
jgi:anthranilate phosphoribosyltransferase